MLKEYFSIHIDVIKVQNPSAGERKEILMLTGLPILLDGHSPVPHALPTFLLRLATEVDWTEERPCFEGICTELGMYYAEIPYGTENVIEEGGSEGNQERPESETIDLVDDVAKKFVQHKIFPALSFLLVPPKNFASDGKSFVKLALLSKLYKVFERC